VDGGKLAIAGGIVISPLPLSSNVRLNHSINIGGVKMAKELLNHYLDVEGEWRRGQPEYLKAAKSVTLNGANLRLYETSRSGMAVLSPVGERLTSYGDTEVYLKIIYTNGSSEYLSAPLGTTIEFSNVQELELNILYLVGNAACDRIFYRAMFNAHCIYERI